MSKLVDKYSDGLDMGLFKHLPDISNYNRNYYIGLDNDLLFELSDDDNTSEWFLISGIDSYFIGNTYTSQGNSLERLTERHT